VEESELLSSKPLIHLESIEDYIGKCNPQNIKSCDGYKSNPVNILILLYICSANLKSVRPFFERSLKIFYVATLPDD